MIKIKSKIGFTLVSLYLLWVLRILFYIFTCSGMYCGMVIMAPAMPWVFLLEGIVGDSIFLFLLPVTLNAILLYYFGCFISKIIKKIK